MSSIPSQIPDLSSKLGRIFDDSMYYIVNGKYREAAMAFLSDTDKIGFNVGIFLMPLLVVRDDNTNAIDMIKIFSGFPSMPDKVRNYFENPELALKEYAEQHSQKK